VRTRLAPTAVGWAALALAVCAWGAGTITALVSLRSIGLAVLVLFVASAGCLLFERARLRTRRQVLDDTVAVGDRIRVDLALDRAPVLARGRVRELLPEALGGTVDLVLAQSMPHHLIAHGRGIHDLGPVHLHLQDPFGLLRMRVWTALPGTVTALPRIEEVRGDLARRAGIARSGSRDSSASGMGEIGVIPRPYVTGDDVRRIHWRASARTGSLMTREDEPAQSAGAVIVLDTREAPSSRAVEDRVVELAASLCVLLASRGWEVRVVDAGADEITRLRRRGDRGPVGISADAAAERLSLIDLAGVGFADIDLGARVDHVAGEVALAMAIGPEGPAAAFDGLDLDRFSARATTRLALAVRDTAPGTDHSAVYGEQRGAWRWVHAPTVSTLDDVLEAAAGEGSV
jgi:uncharacterized protein (DUF58 family)